MKSKTLIIILATCIILFTLLLVYFFVLPNLNPVKRDTKKVSTALFEIPGGSYYGDGFIASQTVAEDNKTTIFSLIINDSPFKTNSNKALTWLKDQGIDLESINYACGPSPSVKATQEEIASCTHILK
ncbi:MAG: hypothetical protein WCI63_02535 [bacterium]